MAKGRKSKNAADDGVLRTNDALLEQATAADKLAGAIPFNDDKKFEYGARNITILPGSRFRPPYRP